MHIIQTKKIDSSRNSKNYENKTEVEINPIKSSFTDELVWFNNIWIDTFSTSSSVTKLLLHTNEFTTRRVFLPELGSKWATCSGFISQEDQQRQLGLVHFQQMSGEVRGKRSAAHRGLPDSSPAKRPPRWSVDEMTGRILILHPRGQRNRVGAGWRRM